MLASSLGTLKSIKQDAEFSVIRSITKSFKTFVGEHHFYSNLIEDPLLGVAVSELQ